jgi:hypothetical protein
VFQEAAPAVAKALWENKDKFLDHLPKIRRLLKSGWLNIVVFGSGGVGKSTLGHLLSGRTDAGSFSYFESAATETMGIDAKVYGTILVSAGQQRRRDASWPSLLKKLSSGKIAGVINVVAYGCHSAEGLSSFQEHRIYKEWDKENNPTPMNLLHFVESFRAEMLRDELLALQSIVSHFESSSNPIWMLTVVAKQDLWWDKRHSVREHYENGEYNNIISSIRQKKGTKFNHDYISTSFRWENLRAGAEVWMPTVSGYDEMIRDANLYKLSESFRQLIENAESR